MLKVEYTTQFKRDLKLASKRKKKLELLREVMSEIVHRQVLSPRLKDHPLSSNWRGHRELHIEPDWLLIYKLVPSDKAVIFVRTGTHADLFE